MNDMIKRIMRAIMLDREFYKEAEADTNLNQEALTIVIIVSVIGGIGAFISSLMAQSFGRAIIALLVTSGLGVANYYIWAYVTHFIGTNMFKGDADPGELLRVLGYASAPRLLTLLGFIPCIGWLISLAGGIWALVAGFFGVQEALDLDTTETLVTVVLGWLAILIITAIVTSVIGVGTAGLGAVLSNFGG
jgi:hypothetical protein